MIQGVHALIYAKNPDETRGFFRDVLGWPSVDAGGGEDAGFGLVTSLRVPGGGVIGLYEPRHPTAFGLGRR